MKFTDQFIKIPIITSTTFEFDKASEKEETYDMPTAPEWIELLYAFRPEDVMAYQEGVLKGTTIEQFRQTGSDCINIDFDDIRITSLLTIKEFESLLNEYAEKHLEPASI